jgi:mannose-1-phosphate guanylyltransferase/phosphomannomutase
MRSKTRLTITLSPELLDRLDRAIDNQRLSNRSQAIETLLRRVLEPTVTQAVILAGGDHAGGSAPPAASIGSRPLLVHTIHHLVEAGIRTVYILAGEDEAELKAVIGSGSYLGAGVHFIEERGRRGTAGALKLAEPYLGDEPLLVIHGDVLTDIDIADFVSFHLDEGSLATIAVKPRHSEPHYGQVMLQGNRITKFLATNPDGDGHDEGISIVNTGVYLFQPGVLGLIAAGRASQLETDVFPRLAAMGELSAFLFQGIWFDISMPENYNRASLRWSEKGA